MHGEPRDESEVFRVEGTWWDKCVLLEVDSRGRLVVFGRARTWSGCYGVRNEGNMALLIPHAPRMALSCSFAGATRDSIACASKLRQP